MIPERENDSKFGNEVNQIYMQHIREKDKIRNKIEALSREKDFIERLAPDDILYMIQKKQETKLTQEMKNFDKKYLKIDQEMKKTKGAPIYDYLKEDVIELGEDKFTREILYFCASRGIASYLEAKEQFDREVLLTDDYYNGIINVRVGGSKILKEALSD